MTVSSIPPVHSSPVTAPVANKPAPAIATKPAAAAPSAATDSDGDRDGSRSGGIINVKA
jgi:hypothetical protein